MMRMGVCLLFSCMIFSVNALPTEIMNVATVKSAHSVKVTVSKLQALLAKGEFYIKTLINHQKIELSAGVKVPPIQSILFGKPSFEAPLIAANPMAGLFVPLMLTVFQDKSGDVYVTYWEPASIAQYLHLESPALKKLTVSMSNNLNMLVKGATQKSA